MTTPASTSLLSTTELLPLLDSPDVPFLLDVREPDEVADWAIPGVVNMPLGTLNDHIGDVPLDRDIVVICAKGMRAAQGAAILAEHGVSSRVLDGGMGAWASTYDTVRQDIGGATVVQIRRRGKGCLSYVVGAGDKAVVIDPSLQIEQYVTIAEANGWTITTVLDTHLHADHISGARDLAKATGATLMLSPSDPFHFDYQPLSDGLALALTDTVGLTVSAVSVPGHTQGSEMYQLGEDAIFTGDTLFLESVGRPDLADQAAEYAAHLYQSLHQRVLALPDETLVLPAHYGAVVDVVGGQFVTKTLGELRQSLPALKLSEEEFVAWAIAHVKDRPPNYQQIVRMNMGDEAVTLDAAEIELGPNRCAVAS